MIYGFYIFAKMKNFCFIILFLLSGSQALFSQETKADKSGFYKAVSSDNLTLIENELTSINKSSFSEKEAYRGTLLMKKSGLVSKAGDKLAFFKEGRNMLENAIKNDVTNAEFRFLRLIIQENAPSFLGYKDNLNEDSNFINQNLASLSAEIRAAISDYVKNSKVLTLHD